MFRARRSLIAATSSPRIAHHAKKQESRERCEESGESVDHFNWEEEENEEGKEDEEEDKETEYDEEMQYEKEIDEWIAKLKRGSPHGLWHDPRVWDTLLPQSHLLKFPEEHTQSALTLVRRTKYQAHCSSFVEKI